MTSSHFTKSSKANQIINDLEDKKLSTLIGHLSFGIIERYKKNRKFLQKNRVYKGLGQIVFMNRKTTYDIDDDLIDSDINALKSPQSRRYKKLENSEGSNDENS